MDHWIDDSHFHRQSQNATDPSSKRGQEIIRHAALDIDIHLFVRENKLAAGKAAPFTHHGRVLFDSSNDCRGKTPIPVSAAHRQMGTGCSVYPALLDLCDNPTRCSLQLPQHQHFCWGLTQATLKTSACGFHAHLKTYRPSLDTANSS
jgi:hypothetical protein